MFTPKERCNETPSRVTLAGRHQPSAPARQGELTIAAITDHDSYVAAAPESFRPMLERLRSLLRGALPDAEEMTAYDMPGFRINGTVVASYAAFSKQLGLYVLAPAIADHIDEIAAAGLKRSKTGVTFSPSKPIPDELVTQLAQSSRRYADS